MVSIKKININNIRDCLKLQLGEGQEKFVSKPERSLAYAYAYYNQCTPFGIYDGEKMVGYVLVIYDDETTEYNVWHLMIDKNEQGKGYGKAAVGKIIEYIKTKPFGEGSVILLTCEPENERALKLYLGYGFKPNGKKDGEEIELELHF